MLDDDLLLLILLFPHLPCFILLEYLGSTFIFWTNILAIADPSLVVSMTPMQTELVSSYFVNETDLKDVLWCMRTSVGCAPGHM